MSDQKSAIRVLIRFFWKKGLSAKAATEQICVVEGETVVNRKTASNWFKCFNLGDTSLEDKPRCGRSSVLNEAVLSAHVTEHPHASTGEMSSTLGTSKNTINRHLHLLNFSNKTPRLDPHDLTAAQAQNRVDICKQLLVNHCDDRFWRRVITGDEKWIFLRNPDKRR